MLRILSAFGDLDVQPFVLAKIDAGGSRGSRVSRPLVPAFERDVHMKAGAELVVVHHSARRFPANRFRQGPRARCSESIFQARDGMRNQRTASW
jgi:hypothetical protein